MRHIVRQSLRAVIIATVSVLAALTWANWPEPHVYGVADRIVVIKSAHTLTLYAHNQSLVTYPISLGRHPVNHKEREGDGRTPSGRYTIDYKNSRSCCYLALHISYPNASDIAHATAIHANPGGAIMIHGLVHGLGWLGRLHRFYDWTNGCVAVTNQEMREIWSAVPAGTPIELRE